MRDERRSTRRQVLQTGASVLVVGGATGTAGCSGLTGGDGGGDDEEDEAATTESGPAFADDLVAYYSFDGGEGDTVSDESDNDNAASIRGASWTDDGVEGGALSFDGEDDLVETPVAYSDLQDGLTLEAWARHDDISSDWSWVFSQTETADQWSQLGVHEDGTGRLRWELRVGDDTQITIDSPEETITEGTWHHWTGTWAPGQGLRLYIDGEQVATSSDEQYCFRGCDASDASSLSSSGPINIGAQGKESQYWQGAIDEAKIYDRALSSDEVVRLVDDSGTS